MTEHSILIVGLETVEARAGGVNRYVADYASALASSGARVELVALGASGVGPPGPAALQWSLPRRILAVARAAGRGRRCDTLDVHFALYGLLPALLRRRTTRLVVHFHGPWAEEGAVEGEPRRRQRVKRWLEAALYRRAAAVVVLSSAFAEILVSNYGVDRQKVTVISGGVDPTRFSPGDAMEARAHLGLPSAGPVLVMVRRLVPRMGHDLALEALAEGRGLLSEATLVIVGAGPRRVELEAKVAQLELGDRVRFLGAVSDAELVQAYRAADLALVPSVALEGFGLVALEALSCATPVVASALGGLTDAVGGLDRSLLVPPGDARALQQRIEAALDGAVPSGEACRRYALSHRWEAVVRQHERVLWPSTATKVCFVGHGAKLSGGELALLRQVPELSGVPPLVILGESGPLVEALEARGVEVQVLAADPALLATRRDEVTLRRLPWRRVVAAAKVVAELRRELKIRGIEVVQTNTLKAALLAGLAGRLAGVPVVWHLRDRLAPDYLPRSTVALMQAAARVLPSAIIANSAATAATVRRGPEPVVIPSPLDAEAVFGDRRGPTFTVTMVGRLAPWKGQDLFLEAFARAFPDGDERAVVVGGALFGEDAYAEALPELASTLGVANRVRFAGFQRAVAPELWAADVAVVASRVPEPFGNVVLEAMACGAVIVAPDAGGPAELIDDEVTGLLYPPEDVDELARALRRLRDDPQLRQQLQTSALAATAPYRPSALAPAYLEVYRSLRKRR